MQLDPLGQIRIEVILGVIAIFVVTHFLLRRTFFLPVIAVLERRQDRLQAADALRAEATETAREAQAEAERIAAEAEEKAEAVVAAAREKAEGERRARLDAAREDAARLLDSGRGAVRAEREEELARLRREAAACVGLACEKLLDRVDPRAVESVVDRLVSRTVT